MSLNQNLAHQRQALERRALQLPPAYERAVERLRKTELAQLGPPENLDVYFPSDVTALSDRDLGRLYGQFCAMVAYATGLASHAWIRLQAAKLLVRRAHAVYTMRGDGRNVTENRLCAEIEAEVVTAGNNELCAEAEAKLFQAKLDEYVVGKEAMSREITRRKDLSERRLP